ncbi:hypothetical protein GCM10009123_12430 [Kangiella japonica]|uniref:Beta-lactamase n=1 Tax=Kangiella japonica TaxID=647384 RepID=A0ABN0SYH9_9GAMM
MKKYLYSDGSEQQCRVCENLVGLLYILGIVAITWGVVDFIITFFTPRGSFTYWLTTIMWSGWFGSAMLYVSIRDTLPLLALKSDKLIIYTGLVSRDRIEIEDIKHLETEYQEEAGLQILITLTTNSKFYAEIYDNSCSIRSCTIFFRKYVPSLKIKSGYRLGPELMDKANIGEDFESLTDKELFEQMDLAIKRGNDELALNILHCLHKKDYLVEGLMEDIYLGSGGEFNDKKALRLYREGYERGSRHAAIGLATMYYHGIEVKADKKRAMEYLKFAEGFRDSNKYYYLGLLHFDGVASGSPNEEKASFYFKKAIAYGSGNGYLGLAMISGKKKQFCKTFKLGLKQIKAEQVS